MKTFIRSLILLLSALMLTSCVHTDLEIGQPTQLESPIEVQHEESIPEIPAAVEVETEVETVDPELMEVVTATYNIGETGPNGGVLFECDGEFLETGEPLYEVPSFDDALSYCAEIGYRLPTIKELFSIYNQLVQTELTEFELTYYWSSETKSEDTAKILNFDTGFEGAFYKSMDFLSVIPVLTL